MTEEYVETVRACSAYAGPHEDMPRLFDLERGDVLKLLNRDEDPRFLKVAFEGTVAYVLKEDAVDSTEERYAAFEEQEVDAAFEADGEGDVASEIVRRGYPALYTISAFFRFIGWVVILAGVLLSVIAGWSVGVAGNGGDGAAAVFGIIVAIGGSTASVVQGVLLLALADLILLFIDVERNTRAAAMNLAEIE